VKLNVSYLPQGIEIKPHKNGQKIDTLISFANLVFANLMDVYDVISVFPYKSFLYE